MDFFEIVSDDRHENLGKSDSFRYSSKILIVQNE